MIFVFNYYKKLILDNRGWIYLILGIFVIGVLLGLGTAQGDPETARKIIAQYASSVDKSLKPGWEQTKEIFDRNVFVILIAALTSLVLGLSSAFVALVNGFVLGLFVGFRDIHTKVNPWQLFLLLFPHGIFEYTGVFLSLSFGLRLGLNWLTNDSKGKRLKVLKTNIQETIAILVLVIIILGLAAFIEGFLTLKIACFLSGICR